MNGTYYYSLFEFFDREHNLILLDSDIQEIIFQVERFREKHSPEQEDPAPKLVPS